MHPLNGKIFLNEKTSSLIWTKGAEMHTHFRAFFKKFFEKIYLFTCSHWEVQNYRVFLKNFLSGKKPSHLFGIGKPKRNLFFRKKTKKLPTDFGGHKKSPKVFYPLEMILRYTNIA